MNDIITKINTTNIEKLYDKIVNSNLTEEELIQELNNNYCLTNHFIFFKSILDSNLDLSTKLEAAIVKIEQNRLLEFKKATENNSTTDYLKTIDWLSKCFLYIETNEDIRKINNKTSNKELETYNNIIYYSIKEDEQNEQYKSIIEEYFKQKDIIDKIFYQDVIKTNLKK